MSNLYSVIPSLTPSDQDVLEAELLAKQILQAKYPDLDLREGTGLRDLVLRPTSFALALLRKANDYYFAQNTLSGVNDTTDTEIVDDIMSNWFLERHLGTNAVISARLYFARAKNVTLPASSFFSTDNKLKFFPASTQTFQASSLSYDAYQNEWYIDVQLVAESAGTDYNLSAGALLYFSNFDPYFLHAEINYLVQSSTDPETNSQFISRASSAISTRNLINDPSITSNLQSAFNVLPRITTVGMGDADMIRDQIKVLFDPEDPRTPTSLSRSGSTATCTLSEHGFEVGQYINLVGGIPTGWNGQYQITSITPSTFTFTVSGTPGTVSLMPTVQSYTAPTLVHTGGMVDIYCGDSVSSDIIQLTTDANGVATLVGPIYSFSRSSVTGGTEDDTIPYTTPVSVATSSLDTATKKLHITTSAAHGLTDGTIVNVSGVSQTKTITSMSCTNLVVTAVSAGHGLTSGAKVTVSGVSPVTYNGTFEITVVDANTFTYVLSANVLVPGTGTMIITNPSVDGDFAITYTGTTSFDISMSEMWTTATNSIDSLAITHNIAYSVTNPYLQTKTVTSLTGTGTTVTATLPYHGYATNRYVTITGATPSYYNGTWKITSVLSDMQFTFSIDSTILAPATGTISAQYVVPWEDFGFSTRQELKIDFGPAYASQTASFEIKYFSHIQDVQDYLDSTDNHILCADYAARGYNVYVLDIHAVSYNGPAPTSGTVSTAAEAYLKTLPAGSMLVLSDLVSALNVAGVTNLQTPLGVTYTYYHRDLVDPITGNVVDYLDPLDKTNVFLLGNVTTGSLSV